MTRLLVALLALVIVASSLVPTAVAANAAASSNVGEQIDAYLQRYMLTARQPGLSAVVMQNNDVLLSAAYGVADREAGRLMTTQTPIAIGSTTKGMTALAVMQLVERGLVDLDAPVVRYVPDFVMDDPRAADITLRQLLSMSSGLQFNDALDGSQDVDGIERHVAGLATAKLQRDPGSGYEYANSAFILAGLVVQRVSGVPYEQYMAEHLFAPLGMDQTTFDLAVGAELGLAQGYGHHRGRAVPLQTPMTRAFNPTGGVLTTARDVERYFHLLLNGGSFGGTRVLSPESVEEMWTPSFRINENVAVGLGWIEEEVHGQRAVLWIGGAGTSGSIFMILPDRGLAIAVLDNYDSADMHNLAKDIVSIALGDEPAARPAPSDPTQLPTVAPDRSSWDSYVGLYVGPRSSVVVTRVRDRLVATVAGGDFLTIARTLGPNEGRDADFVPTSATEFVLVGDSTVLDGSSATFSAGPDGRMTLALSGQPFGTHE